MLIAWDIVTVKLLLYVFYLCIIADIVVTDEHFSVLMADMWCGGSSWTAECNSGYTYFSSQ